MAFTVRFEVWRDAELLLHDALPPGVPLTVGPSRTAVPTRALAHTLALLTPSADGFGLRLAEPLDGHVVVGGRRLRIQQGLLCDPRPEPLLLTDGDHGELRLDDQDLCLRFTVCVRRHFRRHGAPDYRLGTILAAVATVALAGVIVIAGAPRSPRPERTRYLVVRPAAFDRAPRQRPGPRPAHDRSDGSGRRTAAVAAARRAGTAKHRRAAVAASGGPARAADRALRALTGMRADPIDGSGSSLTATASASTSLALDPFIGRAGAAGSRSSPGRTLASLRRPDLRRALAPPPPRESAERPSQDEIARVVAAGSGRIQRCFERELLTSSRASGGRLVVRWIVSEQGRPSSLAVLKDTVSNATIRACVLATVRAWHFPRWRSKTYAIVYPFDFYLNS